MAKPGTPSGENRREPAVGQPPVRAEADAACVEVVFQLAQRRVHPTDRQRQAQVAQAGVEQALVRPARPVAGTAGARPRFLLLFLAGRGDRGFSGRLQ